MVGVITENYFKIYNKLEEEAEVARLEERTGNSEAWKRRESYRYFLVSMTFVTV